MPDAFFIFILLSSSSSDIEDEDDGKWKEKQEEGSQVFGRRRGDMLPTDSDGLYALEDVNRGSVFDRKTKFW